jgi:hypothetical protein
MEKNTFYWTQKYQGWAPLVLNVPIQSEPEITDLSEAKEILAKIMSKI